MANIEVKKELFETMSSQDIAGVVQVAAGLDASRFSGAGTKETQQESMETVATYGPGDTIAEARRCRSVFMVGNHRSCVNIYKTFNAKTLNPKPNTLKQILNPKPNTLKQILNPKPNTLKQILNPKP